MSRSPLQRHSFHPPARGFTLIELLIVIAIILILIAIALPNFLEAQIRAKATKSQAELRTILIALETYVQDFGVYPSRTEQDYWRHGFQDRGLLRLTSPIPYLPTLPQDPFNSPTGDVDVLQTYESGGATVMGDFMASTHTHVVWGRGPVGQTEQPWRNERATCCLLGGQAFTYAATNGTRSPGAFVIFVGDGRWFGVNLQPSDVANPAFLKEPGRQEPYLLNNIDYHGRRPPNSYN